MRRSSQKEITKILLLGKPSLFSTSYTIGEGYMVYFFSFLLAFLAGSSVRAQSAASLVTELESVYLKGEGIRSTFSLGAEKQIKLVVALHSPKYKLEASGETIVNDGAVVHRYNRSRNEVVLDYATKKNAQASRPVDLFNFSTNYTATLLSSKGNRYSLQLTPKPEIGDLFKQAEIESLVFDLKRSAKGKPLQVVSITSKGKGIKKKVTNVSIKPIASLKDSEFSFTTPKNAKVIDLTEE